MALITAKRDVVVTSGDGGNQTGRSFSMPAGHTLEATWARPVDGGRIEFEMETPQGGYLRWLAAASDLDVSPAEASSLIKSPAAITPQLKAFLDTISVPEGTSGPDGYRTCFGGSLCVSADFGDHPRHVFCSGSLCSDAAGRYQFLSTTWDSVAAALGLNDFSPPNQDLGAVELIRRAGALAAVEQGDLVLACTGTGGTTGVAYVWASLPPGRYGQPSIDFDKVQSLFVSFGGQVKAGKT